MAEEEFTVLWDVKSEGSMAPATGWATGKLKVINAAAEEKTKNAGGFNRPAGSVVKTAQVQSAKLVTIVAESAEEAVLAVQKFYSLGGASATPTVLETASLASTGPKSMAAFTGKQAAGVLTEVTVK